METNLNELSKQLEEISESINELAEDVKRYQIRVKSIDKMMFAGLENNPVTRFLLGGTADVD